MTSNDAGDDPWRPAMARDVRRCVLTTAASASGGHARGRAHRLVVVLARHRSRMAARREKSALGPRRAPAWSRVICCVAPTLCYISLSERILRDAKRPGMPVAKITLRAGRKAGFQWRCL